MSFEHKSHQKYHVFDSNSELGEADAFLPYRGVTDEDGTRRSRGHKSKSPQSKIKSVLLGVSGGLNLILGATSLVLASKLRGLSSSGIGTYHQGFSTDLNINNVPLELVRFSGSPKFHANGSAFTDPVNPNTSWPNNVQFFGQPSPEVDQNWKKYIDKRYFSISEEEATRAWGDKRHEYVDERRGGYTAGLDVFHTLHCVNALRMALHPDYYNSSAHHGNHLPHTEHCLEIIRQSIQCYGSTTLIPTKFFEGRRHNYIDSDQVHVCRNFNYLRDYSTSRAKGHGAYVERDRALLDEHKHAVVKQYYKDKKAAKAAKGKHLKGGE
ncbi:hypothetical protein BD289DRAFT_208564 [Coniella lustricola]|uniref:Tat pathway signal sequence n=1 Tax=Coniella lustricola TaxID=2025994 RepID=A0A2T3ABY8_9PEZI|nr:hypothetical protein BD289DRAFT_208564 [Coniella lustricola]